MAGFDRLGAGVRRASLLAMLLLAGCGRAGDATVSVSVSPALTPSPTASASARPTPHATVNSAPQLPLASGIHVPPGFTAYLYAYGIYQPTAMALGPDGRLYVTSAAGNISGVPVGGGKPQLLVKGLPPSLGLVWRGDQLFVSVKGSVVAYTLSGDNLVGGAQVVAGLPTGEHQNDNLVMLENGDFLLGLGSTCDRCAEADPRSATVLRFYADWTYAGVVVRGSRNPYGVAVQPSTGFAYVTINGEDDLGQAQPADILIRARDGEDAGWPRCWPALPDGSPHGSCAGVSQPLAVFPAHSSADGIVFYEDPEFGAAYWDNAFVTEWGTYFGTSVGRRVVRVAFHGSGSAEHGTVTDFASGFQHPLAITVAPDGGLLVGDYGSGQIVEIFRTG
jgi:glucose/arabinose dehydrogenase